MRASNLICYAALLLVAAVSSGIAGAAELRAQVVDGHGKGVANVVVVALPTAAINHATGVAPVAIMDQIDKQFSPSVLVVQVGTSVDFPNHDNIRHHVYSFSSAKQFQLPLYSGAVAQPVVFDKPGVVALGCNIHDWMIGYIYIADTPFFGKTDSNGELSITQLPAGTYVAHIWHPAMRGKEEDTQRPFAVAADAQESLQWQLELNSPPVQRRAPLPHSQAY